MMRWLLLCCFLLGSSPAVLADTVLVLVRHAEKVDDSRDPGLNEQGKARAQALAAMLEDAGIERVYSTDFIRTRDTARPFAEARKLEVELYDGGDLAAHASLLRSRGERALVVGHSNTTADLVRALGGDPGPPIEDDEYDRLYILNIPDRGAVTTTVLRFTP